MVVSTIKVEATLPGQVMRRIRLVMMRRELRGGRRRRRAERVVVRIDARKRQRREVSMVVSSPINHRVCVRRRDRRARRSRRRDQDVRPPVDTVVLQ